MTRMGPLVLGRLLPGLGRDAGGLFHDGKTNAGLVTVLFRDHAPGVLGFLAGLERTLNLGRAFHELVEVHRTELAANHPEIATHDSLLLSISRTGSSYCGRRPPSERPRRRNIPCDRRRCQTQPCSDALRRRCPDGFLAVEL